MLTGKDKILIDFLDELLNNKRQKEIISNLIEKKDSDTSDTEDIIKHLIGFEEN